MPLSGFHATFGYAGGRGSEGPLSLAARMLDSETLAATATGSKVAPPEDPKLGLPMLAVRASADTWFTTGANPADPADPTAPRDFLAAGERFERFVRPGSKVRCAPATLSGLHVIFGYAGGRGVEGNVALLRQIISARTIAAAGISPIEAPPANPTLGEPVMILRASAEVWFTLGVSPADPLSVGAVRDLLAADERFESFVTPGTKVNWALS